MSKTRLFSVFIFVYWEIINKEAAAFTSWQEPPIPTFHGTGNATVVLRENHAVNTSTGIILRVLNATGNVSYSMNANKYLSVDRNSGEVFLISSLDYETNKTIKCIIFAMEDGAFHEATVTMTVSIADINDHKPYFDVRQVNNVFLDSVAKGTNVTMVKAKDGDSNSKISYSIVDGDNGDFYVDSVTGVIYVQRPLMASRKQHYRMTVLAVDAEESEPISFNATVLVIISLKEDTSITRCEPTEITVNISAHLKTGETVPMNVLCSNWLVNKPYFFLGSNQLLQHYNIAANNDKPYLILVSSQPNSLLKGTIEVYDGPQVQGRRLLNAINLTISAVSVNDAPTISPNHLYVNILENVPVGHVIGNFTVHDPDEGEWGITRVYSDDKPDFVDIRTTVGGDVELVISRIVDVDIYKTNQNKQYLTESEYSFTDYPMEAENMFLKFLVVVSDSVGLSETANVLLEIADVNDNSPICDPFTVVKRIPRDIERAIVNLGDFCNDADLTYENNFLRYEIMTDSCSGFAVHEYSGTISVATDNPFIQPSCQILVNVNDAGTPKLNTQLKIEIQFLECPNDTDYLGIPWKRGIPGQYTPGNCPKRGRGWVKRYCDENGAYHDPVYNCTRSEISDIYNKLFSVTFKTKAAGSILDDLINATSVDINSNDRLMVGDVETVNKILSKITDVVKANSSDIQRITNSFIEVANNIMSENTTTTWKVMINETGSGADTVIDNLDHFVEKIATATDSNLATTVFAKTNVWLKIGMNLMCDRGIHFPNRTLDDVPTWAINTLDSVNIPCSNSSERKSYSSALYRDVSEIIPSRSTGSKLVTSINAPVISFTYYPKVVGTLESPVEITFQIYDDKMESPGCSFWTRNASANGTWSGEGCWLHEYDKAKQVLICKCDHLTNFAVLMAPSQAASTTDSIHHVTLSIITITGCVISMICLFITVVIHVILWRTVKSVRSIINMNLSSSLFIAYLLFLTGVNQTENKGLCTAIAVLLHLVYLIVFLIMLTEGLNLGYTVLKPLSTRKPGIPLLVASYVLAVIIVGISMAAVQLEGYGSDSFCWLSTDTGLIWAFILPVIIIILVNGIIICVVIKTMCGTVAMSRKSNKEKARAGIRSVIVLMPLMGVTWVFGIFSVNDESILFQYLFAIFNSLQGLLIFIFHCVMNRKVKDGIRHRFCRAQYKCTSASTSAEPQKFNTKSQVTQNTVV